MESTFKNKIKTNEKSKRGFTLVELIVVIAILGLLAAIAIPRFSQYVAKAKWEATNANAMTVYRAMVTVEAELIEEGIIQNPNPGGMYFPTVNEEFKKRVQEIVPSNITINTAYNNGSVKPTDNENIFYINYTPPGSDSPYGVLYVDMRLPSYTNPSGFTGPTMFFWTNGEYGLDYKPF